MAFKNVDGNAGDSVHVEFVSLGNDECLVLNHFIELKHLERCSTYSSFVLALS